MDVSSKTTTDHEEIRQWAEARGGTPAKVTGTEADNPPGILRIAFADTQETDLEPISWDEWFEQFDSNRLAFLYQEETEEGGPSRFNKLVNRDGHRP